MIAVLVDTCRHNPIIDVEARDVEEARAMIFQAIALVKHKKQDEKNVDRVLDAMQEIGYEAELAQMGPYDD